VQVGQTSLRLNQKSEETLNLSNFRTSSDEFEEDVEEVKDDDEDSSDSIMEVETESEVEMRCPTYLTFLA
jgi:hypothetical protein